LIDAAGNLAGTPILMTLYSTAMRRSELVRLGVEDSDTERMAKTAMCRSAQRTNTA